MVRIINTGGTFNKRYDPIAGDLIVPVDDKAVLGALDFASKNVDFRVSGILYKDSLFMDDSDRDLLCMEVDGVKEKSIVIVHGTDTMDKSAKALDMYLKKPMQKVIVFTGAMIPFSIDKVEACANLSSAVTASKLLKPGIYIAMHLIVDQYESVVKNRDIGLFERVK